MGLCYYRHHFWPFGHHEAIKQRRAIWRNWELFQNEERSDELALILYDQSNPNNEEPLSSPNNEESK